MSQHQIASLGAGLLVYLEEHVLLVQLNYGPFKGSWILPGGMVEASEVPHQTALRETFEETGLNFKINNLIMIRHRKQEQNSSNIYWVFSSEPTEPLETLKSQIHFPEEELMDAKFWSTSVALTDASVRPLTKYYIQHFLKNKNSHWKFTPSPFSEDDAIYGDL